MRAMMFSLFLAREDALSSVAELTGYLCHTGLAFDLFFNPRDVTNR